MHVNVPRRNGPNSVGAKVQFIGVPSVRDPAVAVGRLGSEDCLIFWNSSSNGRQLGLMVRGKQ